MSRPLIPVVRLDPAHEQPYPLVLRGQGYTWWRSLLGVLIGLSLYVLTGQVVTQLVIGIGWSIRSEGLDWTTFYRTSMAFERPVGMLAAHLGIAILIPVSLALVAFWHGIRARWLVSVQPGFRWRYLVICLVTSAIGLAAVYVVSALVEGVPAYAPQPGFVGFLVVIVLTSPLQAAAEEFFFRGYLMQALGSLVANPWFGIVVSAAVFAAFHGTQNAPLVADRFVFGLLAGILVTRTGGLEAGIAAHVANNILAFTLAGLTTSIAGVMAVRTLTWAQAGFDVLGFALVALVAWLIARRMNLATRTP